MASPPPAGCPQTRKFPGAVNPGDLTMTLADNWLVTLGIASIVVSNLACLPYIRDMLCGSTRPVRST